MAISVSLSITPAAPGHGDTVTAIYTVTGNDPIPPAIATVNGDASAGGADYPVTSPVTLPGTPALPVTYVAPTCPGLTFTPTAQPGVFTAVVP